MNSELVDGRASGSPRSMIMVSVMLFAGVISMPVGAMQTARYDTLRNDAAVVIKPASKHWSKQSRQAHERTLPVPSSIAPAAIQTGTLAPLRQVIPDERSRRERERAAKTLLRLEFVLRTMNGSSGTDGLHIDLFKGTTTVDGGAVFVNPALGEGVSRPAWMILIPPVQFENDWTLRIRPPDRTEWTFRIERVKGYFGDGSAAILQSASPTIRWWTSHEKKVLLPLRRHDRVPGRADDSKTGFSPRSGP